MKRLSCCRLSVLVALCALFVVPAQAQYISGFEDLNASAAGVPLTGQDDYYIPAGTVSADWMVYTYAGNILGIPQNPTGDDQFVGGMALGDGSTYARAQRNVSFAGENIWVLAYDFCAAYLESGAATNNIGSFSMRADAANVNFYIHLMAWVDLNNPTSFNAWYLAYDAGGTQFPQPGTSPGSGWDGLELNHWYRAWSVVDLDTNMFLEVGIEDLETGSEDVYFPDDWYLAGGSGGPGVTPDCFRFFAGGTSYGNVLAFDNISIDQPITATAETTWGSLKALYE